MVNRSHMRGRLRVKPLPYSITLSVTEEHPLTYSDKGELFDKNLSTSGGGWYAMCAPWS